jgi:UTP-glucose-1-phosphate uridylyltransferase
MTHRAFAGDRGEGRIGLKGQRINYRQKNPTAVGGASWCVEKSLKKPHQQETTLSILPDHIVWQARSTQANMHKGLGNANAGATMLQGNGD